MGKREEWGRGRDPEKSGQGSRGSPQRGHREVTMDTDRSAVVGGKPQMLKGAGQRVCAIDINHSCHVWWGRRESGQ